MVDKANMKLAEKLESYARKGGLTQGLHLQKANLAGVNLVNRGQADGYDFSGTDFYRANLQHAHLFNITLRDGSLMKANLCEANLHCADLEGCNLLGVKLADARLDNLHLGKRLAQEKQAIQYRRQGNHKQAIDHFEQAEEIYRNLKKAAEDQGLFRLAGQYSYKELWVRRHLLPRFSLRWWFSHLVDTLCGYGEKPENTVLFSILLIMFCAVGYFLFGVNYSGEMVIYRPDASVSDNLNSFLLSCYYSVVTFTTLGYGDITPVGITRFFAVIEAFLGSFTIALFVVVFVKRMSR